MASGLTFSQPQAGHWSAPGTSSGPSRDSPRLTGRSLLATLRSFVVAVLALLWGLVNGAIGFAVAALGLLLVPLLLMLGVLGVALAIHVGGLILRALGLI